MKTIDVRIKSKTYVDVRSMARINICIWNMDFVGVRIFQVIYVHGVMKRYWGHT